MIKAKVGNVALLGLEAGNLQRLQEDKPMVIQLHELGFRDITIAIVFGTHYSVALPKYGRGHLVAITLGLESLQKLQAGETIMLKLKDYGLDDIVVGIVYGDTQTDILTYIKNEFGLNVPNIDPVNNKPI